MRAPSLIFLALFPVLGCAEVMDKEFSFSVVLLWGLSGAFFMFFAARFKPMLLLILVPVISLFFFAHLSELLDPYVGSAVADEAGQVYVFISWIAPAVIFVSGVTGFALRCRDVRPGA
jgi:hypothetical protein